MEASRSDARPHEWPTRHPALGAGMVAPDA
jgi:hypothetical protein